MVLTLSMQVPEGSSSNGVLSSAAASIQLLPHLLGFPVKLTASDEVLPSPGPLPGPEGAPREAVLSYKGAMLDGLQASRKLHNVRPPGHGAPVQSQETYQSSPGQYSVFEPCKAACCQNLAVAMPPMAQLEVLQVVAG